MVGVAASALVAACAPAPPSSGPAGDPAAPVITRFSESHRASGAPQTSVLSWRISDANRDPLTCRIDTDGDATFDRVISPCSSSSTALASFVTPGARTLSLEVDDGNTDPVSQTLVVDVGAAASEPFNITVRLAPGMDPAHAAAFEAAARRWETVIRSGVPDEYLSIPGGVFAWIPAYEGTVDDLLIDAQSEPIDGPKKILGQAGAVAARDNGIPFYGVMRFDSADLDYLADRGALQDTILHEMGHVLGLGGGWLLRGFVSDILTGNPTYNQPAANSVWGELGGTGQLPLENVGGLGTLAVHWNEAVFGSELMTGYLNVGVAPLSRLTIAGLADLGYGVDLSVADPYSLPGSNAAEVIPTGEVQPVGLTAG